MRKVVVKMHGKHVVHLRSIYLKNLTSSNSNDLLRTPKNNLRERLRVGFVRGAFHALGSIRNGIEICV